MKIFLNGENMRVKEFDRGVILEDAENFNLNHVFDCGQCFRWIKQPDGGYIGVAKEKVIKIISSNNNITIFNTNLQEFFEIWENYFDLKADYRSYQERLSFDETMKKAISGGEGIRILRQDTFEALISFIISASNNIPRIMKIVDSLCSVYGDEIEFEGKTYRTFPTVEKMRGVTVADLEPIRSGFRAKYIVDAVEKVLDGTVCLEKLPIMPRKEAREHLMQINGVGPKVADCVLIFGAGRLDVFPVDTWIDKAMKTLYPAACQGVNIRQAGENLFGDICGLAQQYIFYYARENKLEKTE